MIARLQQLFQTVTPAEVAQSILIVGSASRSQTKVADSQISAAESTPTFHGLPVKRLRRKLGQFYADAVWINHIR